MRDPPRDRDQVAPDRTLPAAPGTGRGGFYVRNWIVQRVVQLVPWWLLQGTVFQSAVLRALGARIGRRLHLSRGVNLLQGGWDLLQVGDDVSLGHDANAAAGRPGRRPAGHRPRDPRRRQRRGSARRHGPAHCARRRRGARGLFVPGPGPPGPGRRIWDGAPARRAGVAPPAPDLPPGERAWPPHLHGVVMIAARFAVTAGVYVPLFLFVILCAQLRHEPRPTAEDAAAGHRHHQRRDHHHRAGHRRGADHAAGGGAGPALEQARADRRGQPVRHHLPARLKTAVVESAGSC